MVSGLNEQLQQELEYTLQNSFHPSRKPPKLDEPEMQDTTG